MKPKTLLGHVLSVLNQWPKSNSAVEHEHVWLKRNGKLLPFAFTKDQLDTAHERAMSNQEDIPRLKRSILQLLFSRT